MQKSAALRGAGLRMLDRPDTTTVLSLAAQAGRELAADEAHQELRKWTGAAYEQFPQLAVLPSEDDEPEDWLCAGEALEHVLLGATLNNVSASFLIQVIERDDMRDSCQRSWPLAEHPQNDHQARLRERRHSDSAATHD